MRWCFPAEAQSRIPRDPRQDESGRLLPEEVRAEFEKIEKNLNKYTLKTEEKIVRRLESAKGKYAVGDVFTYRLTQRSGKFSLRWEIDQDALDRRIKLEGAYLLKTDLTKSAYPAAAVLQEYKEQIHVERRIGDMKGPLAIAPMFLEKPLRIAGMMYILFMVIDGVSIDGTRRTSEPQRRADVRDLP